MLFAFEDMKDKSKSSSDEEAIPSDNDNDVTTSLEAMAISSPDTEETAAAPAPASAPAPAPAFLFSDPHLKILDTKQTPEKYLESIKNINSVMEKGHKFAPEEYVELRLRITKRATRKVEGQGQESQLSPMDCELETKCWEDLILSKIQMIQRPALNQSQDSQNRRRPGYRTINVW
jgi:hypothetical protein